MRGPTSRGSAGVASRCVTFVSGGTEAANSGAESAFRRRDGRPAARAADRRGGEHLCVLSGHRFPAQAVEIAPLAADGRIDLDWLDAAVRKPGRVLLALQAANNETGVIQPVARGRRAGPRGGGLRVLRRRSACRTGRLHD